MLGLIFARASMLVCGKSVILNSQKFRNNLNSIMPNPQYMMTTSCIYKSKIMSNRLLLARIFKPLSKSSDMIEINEAKYQFKILDLPLCNSTTRKLKNFQNHEIFKPDHMISNSLDKIINSERSPLSWYEGLSYHYLKFHELH